MWKKAGQYSCKTLKPAAFHTVPAWRWHADSTHQVNATQLWGWQGSAVWPRAVFDLLGKLSKVQERRCLAVRISSCSPWRTTPQFPQKPTGLRQNSQGQFSSSPQPSATALPFYTKSLRLPKRLLSYPRWMVRMCFWIPAAVLSTFPQFFHRHLNITFMEFWKLWVKQH